MDSRDGEFVLLFVGYTQCTSLGLLLFKHGVPAFESAVSAGRWWSRAAMVTGAALYAISFALWLVIAFRVQLTIAYPVALGLSLAAVTTGAIIWLGAPLSTMRVVGSLLILAGIALIVR